MQSTEYLEESEKPEALILTLKWLAALAVIDLIWMALNWKVFFVK